MPSVVVITSAGLAALVNATNNGTLPVKITKFGLGSGNYTPSADQTALQSKFKEITALSGGDVGDNTIHVTMNDTSSDAYTVNELGVYLEDGTLFAVSSQPTGSLLQKAAGSQGLLSVDFVISGGTSAITVEGDTNFFNPPATTETAGVVKLATAAEAKLGTEGTKAITAATLAATLGATIATETQKGLVQLASDEDIEAGTSETKVPVLKKIVAWVKKYVKDIGLKLLPIGAVIFYLGTEIPEGFLLCNGASLSRTEYPELFSVLGTKCGAVDSAHFNLPDTHHRVLEGTSVLSEVGQYQQAGLPNMKGVLRINLKNLGILGADSDGVFEASPGSNDLNVTTKSGTGQNAVTFSASRASSLYQDGLNEVRVNSIFAQALIRYA